MTDRKLKSPVQFVALPALAVLLAGCAGDRVGLPGASPPPRAEPAVPRPSPPPVSMAGPWVLQSGGGQCNMNFGQADPTAAEGTVAPGGGCPGNFFTTRRWSFDSDGLLLSDHNARPKARLSLSGGGFSGSSATGGAPVTLTR